MEISVKQSNHLKVVAILMMLCLHLFNRNYIGLFEPLLFVGKQPLVFYISLFCDACVPIFAFVSGYGLYYKYQQDNMVYAKENIFRLKNLYLNYWIILFIFPVILGLVLKFPGYPGTIIKIVNNMTGFDTSYNGAWWFFTTYVIFVLTSGFWFDLIQKLNPYLYITVLFIIYILCFYLRLNKFWEHKTSLEFLNIIIKDLAFFFCTLFQFMLGAFALKYKWNTAATKLFKKIKFKNWIILVLMAGLVVVHGIVPNFIIAPFTGLCFIFLFCQLDLNESVIKGLDLLVPHSTNMWLTHMFFYMIFFPGFIYSFRYPVIIIFVLVLLCVISSVIIHFFNNKLSKIIR